MMRSKFENYLAPELDVCIVAVEKGFEISGNLENPEQGGEMDW